MLQLLLIANSANAKHLRCSPESSSCIPQVICSRGVKQSSCRHSDPLPSGPISPPSSLVWPHGGKLLFSWLAFLLGEAAKPAAQSHKHKQVLPLSVAAASHQRSSAECRNRTFSFLISLSIFNWSHSPPLPCHAGSCREQLAITEHSIRPVFLENTIHSPTASTRGAADMLCSAPLHIQLKIAETGLCSLPFCPSGPVPRTAEHRYSAIQRTATFLP